MGITKTLGGDRLGAGRKMTVELENFGRSSHNLGKIVTTDQAAGTLVPYNCGVILNGGTYYIDMATNVRTLPSNGPVFGSFKHQIDWFVIPIRLYIAALHNNALGIGLKMDKVYLPTMQIPNHQTDQTVPVTEKINQSSLMAYLGVRGLPTIASGGQSYETQALFMLAYWDIYKNYYANKQEEIGVYIGPGNGGITYLSIFNTSGQTQTIANLKTNRWEGTFGSYGRGSQIWVRFNHKATQAELKAIPLYNPITKALFDWNSCIIDQQGPSEFYTMQLNDPDYKYQTTSSDNVLNKGSKGSISLKTFELSNIDEMRDKILAAPKTAPFLVNSYKVAPYSDILAETDIEETKKVNNSYYTEMGLGVKTYLSDRFNNWLSTEWIDGVNGINEITAVDVSDGKLTMDALILSKKVFDMLNRIAVSGGSYNDWQEAVYGTKTVRMAESPVYMGGMSSEIVFDEVVSNASTIIDGNEEPLGSLAGRGIQRNTRGGKSIKIKVNEPSIVMCIGSITPRICYSQGNKWWTRLKTMNDFHKPNLDAIGFQELITEEMVATETQVENGELKYFSAGKQPSWIEYMTDVNESYGSFAAGGELEWMVLNRKYDVDETTGRASDITTYIDPTLYNVAFANARLDAMNFWVNIGFDITARRVMSAKQIPNM